MTTAFHAPAWLSLRKAAVSALLLLTVALPLRAGSDAAEVLRAMSEELGRSMRELRLEGMARPYFIAYRMFERHTVSAGAVFGGPTGISERATREIEVELRVGDYAFDNSNQYSGGPTVTSGVFGGGAVSIDNDGDALRRSLWLATDNAYKQALKDLSAKEALVRTIERIEELPDFTRAAPCTLTADMEPPPLEVETAREYVDAVTARFSRYPRVQYSSAGLYGQNLRVYYVDSEGTRFVRAEPTVTMTVSANTQLDNGMPLEDYRSLAGPSIRSLGEPRELARLADTLATTLTRLCGAPMVERYVGPVLFEGQAAAELTNRVFVPLLCAPAIPLCANPGQRNAFGPRLFLDMLGGRVLPENLSVIDDPTLTQYNGKPLMGSFAIDDEGVRSSRKELVSKGILRTLLVSRAPVTGISQSSGNRRGRLPLPGNLLVLPRKGLRQADLKKELLRVVRKRGLEYGIIVRRLGNPSVSQFAINRTQMSSRGTDAGATIKNCIAVYKVYADGREEMVRNAEISGLSAESFKHMLAVSRECTVEHVPLMAYEVFPFSGGEARLVSLVTPSMLFEDVVVKKPQGEVPKPPILPNPLLAKGDGK